MHIMLRILTPNPSFVMLQLSRGGETMKLKTDFQILHSQTQHENLDMHIYL